MIDDLLSQGVRDYFHWGTSNHPIEDPNNVAKAADSGERKRLLRKIDSIIKEMYHIPVDWEGLGWPAGAHYVRDRVRANHPELSEEAIYVLYWYFSYATR